MELRLARSAQVFLLSLGMRGLGVYGTRGDRSEDKQVEGELGWGTWGGDSSQW